MDNVYIVSAKRTAIGTFGGALKDYQSADLAVPVIQDIVQSLELDITEIDEVILGNVFKAGGKGNPARQAAIKAGLSQETPAMTIDKQCASGLRAITIGAAEIVAGNLDFIIAGGTESMSNVPHLLLNGRWGKKLGDLMTVDGLLYDGLHCAIEGYHMGVTAENLARKYEITRNEQDEFALSSQEKAKKAIINERFKEEIVPLPLKRKGELFSTDEHPYSTSLEKLGQLSSVFEKNGTVTAGNASGLNDGAAVVALASEEAVQKYNLTPIGKLISMASAAVDPSIMGIGPVPATKKALKNVGMEIKDLDLVELNEAFAAQVLAVNKELGVPEEIINVNGGAIALGHPVGCSGARIVVSLLHELRKQKKQFGLASLCVGGGQGVSVVVEAM